MTTKMAYQPRAPQALREYRLAGHLVPQAIYNSVAAAKRNGQRMFLVEAGDIMALKENEKGCGNCNGYGHMAIQTVLGGPFREVPQSGGRGEGESAIHVSAAWHDGAWYQVTTDVFDCPVCRPTREVVL